MSNFPGESSNGAEFHRVHAERDPESNWSVDLHRLLEEYLAKICAGEILSEEDDRQIQVNFAEAALLLHGSVQVYSRKVEYLYSLVLHTLEFISQQRQQDEVGVATDQPEETGPSVAPEETDDSFWGFDDVPVEAKNSLDTSGNNDVPTNQFVKPPANLVVLEGDCLDTSGDAGELESYLLAANDLFQDFILLDPCDAVAVDDFLKSDRFGKRQDGGEGPSSARKNFLSPRSRSGASKHRSSVGKNQKMNPNQSPLATNNFDLGPDPDDANNEFAFDMDNAYPGSDMGGSDDDDDSNDPWKPLNPHEAGNLKVKPFKKVKASRKPAPKTQRMSFIMDQFPLARRDGTTCPEFIDLWEKRRATREKQHDANPPLYEQLRQSLINGGNEDCNAFGNSEGVDEDNGYADVFQDFGEPEPDIPDNVDMDVDAQHHDKPDDDAAQFDTNDACGHEDPLPNASLEDLCRSHLDALLANIAENEKQTELAARVSTWKQNIERNLEEQDSHPPFDIHEYGERILTKLSVEADCGDPVSFADVVSGSEVHDVARSFSALLQLVNNGDVDLDKGKDVGAQCYTAVNPFYVRLGRNKKQGRVQVQSSKKRVTSPIQRVSKKGEVSKKSRTEDSPESSSRSKTRSGNLSNGKIALKNGKVGGIRCTPESKRRRKSRYVEAEVDPSRSDGSAVG